MLVPYAPLHRTALMQSRSIFAVELTNPWTWTVEGASQGALEFFRDAPFGSIIGQSLVHLMLCDDLPVDSPIMHRIWCSSCGPVRTHDGCQQRLHVIDYSASVRYIDEIFSRDPLEWQHCTGGAHMSDGLAAIVPSRYVPIVAHFLPIQNRERSASQNHDHRRLLIATFEDPAVMFFGPNPHEDVKLEKEEGREEELVVFTRENRGRSAQHATRGEKKTKKEKEKEKEKMYV